MSRRFCSSLPPTCLAAAALWLSFAPGAFGEGPAAEPQPLLIAFSSLRDRPAFASLYFYRHDGAGEGRIVASAPPAFESSDTNAALTGDGALCLYTGKQVGGFPPRLRQFDLRRQLPLDGLQLPGEFASLTHARLSGDGNLLPFCAWSQAGQPGGWDVLLFDRSSGGLLNLPGLNSESDEREAAISGDGRKLAFVSNRPGGSGLSDIYVYDRESQRLLATPGLNSPARELNPVWNGDGSLLAFVSDRPGGQGGKDVYLYHVGNTTTVPLAANSPAHEQSPALSPDGRYLAFVSERTRGEGERDVYLYDRRTARLLPTPGLNSAAEDFDPAITVAP